MNNLGLAAAFFRGSAAADKDIQDREDRSRIKKIRSMQDEMVTAAHGDWKQQRDIEMGATPSGLGAALSAPQSNAATAAPAADGGLGMVQPGPDAKTASGVPFADAQIEQGKKALSSIYQRQQRALDAGRVDLFNQYGAEAAKIRPQLIGTAAQRAAQMYGLTKDLNAFITPANLVHDGAEFDKVERGQDGSITVQMRQFGQPAKPLTFKDDKEFIQGFSDYINPTAAQQRAAKLEQQMLEQSQERFKTDEEIRKKKAEGYTLGPGQQRFGADGNPIASTPQERKPLAPVRVKLSGENAGEAVFDPNTREFVTPPAGTAGPQRSPSLDVKQVQLQKQIQDLLPVSADGTSVVGKSGKALSAPPQQIAGSMTEIANGLLAANDGMSQQQALNLARDIALLENGDTPTAGGITKVTPTFDQESLSWVRVVDVPGLGPLKLPGKTAPVSAEQKLTEESKAASALVGSPQYQQLQAYVSSPEKAKELVENLSKPAEVSKLLSTPQGRQFYETAKLLFAHGALDSIKKQMLIRNPDFVNSRQQVEAWKKLKSANPVVTASRDRVAANAPAADRSVPGTAGMFFGEEGF
jgi:hypothetical protein